MTQEWLDQVVEDVVDPSQRIIDPHHHLWPTGAGLGYDLAALTADVKSGHAVEKTVFVECNAAYRADGPAFLAPTGETEFVAAEALGDPNRLIGGIIGSADLADLEHLDAVLDLHLEAGQGLFRGIRDRAHHDPHPETLANKEQGPAGKYGGPAFRQGVADSDIVRLFWRHGITTIRTQSSSRSRRRFRTR